MAEQVTGAREERKAFVEAALPAGGTFGPAPEAGDLALINERYALAPLAAEELYVRRMGLANDALDRTYERFPPAVLERFRSRRRRRARRQPAEEPAGARHHAGEQAAGNEGDRERDPPLRSWSLPYSAR